MADGFYSIIKGDKPVLVDFSAEWCGPCRMMAPVLEQLKNRMGSNIRILKIDVDRNNELASRMNIRNVPTLMLFQEGERKWTGSGVMTSDFIEKVVRDNCRINI
ncbi:MAG: thioredoxin [Bacteroidales bacterium]